MKNYELNLCRYWIALGVFILTLGLYLMTLAPGWGVLTIFNTWDGIEYVLASFLLGIDHPNGHPFYLVMAKFSTFIPFGSIGYRLIVLSSLFGAGTIVFLFLGLEKLLNYLVPKPNRSLTLAVSCFTSLSFAVTPVFWMHCLIVEVHTTFLFLITSFFFSFFSWIESADTRWLYNSIFLLGLSFSTSLLNTLSFAAPGLLVLLIWLLVRGKSSLQMYSLMAVLIIIPLFLYLYYPIRIRGGPAFIHPMNLIATQKFGSSEWFFWYLMGKAWLTAGMFDIARIFIAIPPYLHHIRVNVTLVHVIFGLIGLGALLVRFDSFIIDTLRLRGERTSPNNHDRFPVAVWLLLTILSVMVSQLSLKDPSNPGPIHSLYVANFFVPSFIMVMYLSGIGLFHLMNYVQQQHIHEKLLLFFNSSSSLLTTIQKRAWFLLFIYGLALVPVHLLVSGLQQIRLDERDDSGYHSSRGILEALPESSIVISKLTYILTGTYFLKVEPILTEKNILIINPESYPFISSDFSDPLHIQKTWRLKQFINNALLANREVFISGDCVEQDKSPENLLLADVMFRLNPPVVIGGDPEAIVPSEIFLYRALYLREAQPIMNPPQLQHTGITNTGTFDHKLALLGYDSPVVENMDRGRKKLVLKLYWKALSDLEEDYLGFVSIINDKLQPGNGTGSYFTVGGVKGTSTWKKGQIFEDELYYYLPRLTDRSSFLIIGLINTKGEKIPYVLPEGETSTTKYDFVLLLNLTNPE